MAAKPLASAVSYAGAFTGVAEEARRAADLCNRLQDSAMHLLDNYAGPDRARLMSELQHLDAVTQTLAALADFSRAAAVQARTQNQIDFAHAVSNIGLADMAYRLRIACFEETEDDWRLEGESGDVDMF
jgi:hypothetical protein